MPTEPLLICASTQSRNRTRKHSGLSRVALPIGVSGHVAQSSPGWTRTTDPLFVGELFAASPQDHIVVVQWTHRELHLGLRDATPASSYWTMSPFSGLLPAEAVRLELTSELASPPVFKTGSSSSRMTSVLRLRKLESNQRPPGSEPGVTTNSNCSAVSLPYPRHAIRGHMVRRSFRGEGFEPSDNLLQRQAWHYH